jgi:sugar phosphate isomerase/epimerase
MPARQAVPEALEIVRDLGLDSAGINSRGFVPPVHLPIDDIRAGQDARNEYLGLFSATGMTLTALHCNGNPLHPEPEVREKHGNDVREAIELARLLGVRGVVTMSGLPATDACGTLPAWSVLPWDGADLDARDYQWHQVAVPYWENIQGRAAEADVKVCIEMHPHNVV